MEHVMYPGAVRKTQVIGHRSDAFQHLVEPRVLGGQFATVAGDQGFGGPVQQAKEHPVPHRELQLSMMGVVVATSILLCLEEASAHLLQELVAAGEQSVDGVRVS